MTEAQHVGAVQWRPRTPATAPEATWIDQAPPGEADDCSSVGAAWAWRAGRAGAGRWPGYPGKRLLDVTVLALAALPALVVVLLSALAILCEDGRPVLLRQRRVGYRGQPFMMLKLRTMSMAAEPESEVPEPAHVTRVGRVLRCLSLDELPQLVNVARGEMSIVGPRPHFTHRALRWDTRQRRRLTVLPGMTGLAQTSGRNRLSWAERTELDLRYVATRSVRLDIAILIRSVWVVLTRDGLHGHPTEERDGAAHVDAEQLTASAGAAAVGTEPGDLRISPSGRPVRRRVVRLVAVLSCLAVLGGGWLVVRVQQVHGHLARAAHLVQLLQQQVERADLRSARATLGRLRQETAAARALTQGVTWRAGSRVPEIGDDLAAVATATAALDDVVRRGAAHLVAVADSVNPETLLPRDGRIELAGLRQAAPRLLAAAAVGSRALDTVTAIRTAGLRPEVSSAIKDLRTGLRRAATVLSTAARAAVLLPSMLGAQGPRTYLVLFQNLAEVRATGGIPGAYAVVRTERGNVRLVEQGTAAADLRTFDKPVLPLDDNQVALYTERLGTYPADINLTPHFPTAAKLAREMYRRRAGHTVDGVLATDPVALSYLLRATGPVRISRGKSLTADNAVPLLLHQVYAQHASHAEQDRYLAAAARTVFDVLRGGRADPRAAIAALARAAEERRILVWSAHPDEQRQIEATSLGGALPRRDSARPSVGVFLNDGSGAKLDYYLRPSAGISATCRSDGRQKLALRVTLRSTAPAAGLPPAVTGMALAGDPYTIRVNVLIFSPVDGAVSRTWMDGRPAPMGAGREGRRAVAVLTVDLPPGESRTVRATLVSGVVRAGATPPAPRLLTTPTITPWRTQTGQPRRCGGVR